jgi:hypothetical protein
MTEARTRMTLQGQKFPKSIMEKEDVKDDKKRQKRSESDRISAELY